MRPKAEQVLIRAFGALLLATVSLPASATNRCLTPAGKILYTDEACESVGAKHDREVKATVSTIETPRTDSKSASAKPAARNTRPTSVFRKSPRAPVLVVCYDPANARTDVSPGDIDAAIRSAVQLWNDGCNVNYEYLGTCAAEGSRHDRPVDYKVWWAAWDDTKMGRGNANVLLAAREHAIAAASPRVGVALNRDIKGFVQRYRRAIVHEFGHVVGIGHSPSPVDLMYSGGTTPIPTVRDLAACNHAIETRFGVKGE